MRYLVALWALPLGLFWGWFGLSYYDVNFGYLILSRQVHDLVFDLYGQILGLAPEQIPWLVAKACSGLPLPKSPSRSMSMPMPAP